VTVLPEKKEPGEDSLRKKLPPGHVAAQVASTLVCAFAMSFLGTAGTLAGLATGSLLSSTVPVLIEHTAGRSAKRLKEQRDHYLKRGYSENVAHAMAEADVKAENRPHVTWTSAGVTVAYPRRRRKKSLIWTGVTAVLVAAVSLAGLTVVEAAAGKPASAIVQNKAGTGTTLGGYSYTPPSPSPSPSTSSFSPAVSISPSTSSFSPSVSPNATPSLSLSPSPGTSLSVTPGVSPSPSISTSAVTGSPAATQTSQVPAGTQEPPPDGGL
jgi:hypothetical protein